MSENDKIEMLLRPRVMVTNEWPGCGTIKKGYTLTGYLSGWMDSNGNQWKIFDLLSATELCKRYPGNFREMHWSEGRKPEEMPMYLKVNTEKSSLFSGYIHEVRLWAYWPSEELYCRLNDQKSLNDLFKYPATIFLPATEAEFITYQNSQP